MTWVSVREFFNANNIAKTWHGKLEMGVGKRTKENTRIDSEGLPVLFKGGNVELIYLDSYRHRTYTHGHHLACETRHMASLPLTKASWKARGRKSERRQSKAVFRFLSQGLCRYCRVRWLIQVHVIVHSVHKNVVWLERRHMRIFQ